MQIKKLLGSVLALALVASVSQANAELLKNFKLGGSVEMAAVSARNVLTFRTRSSASNAVPTDHIGTGQTRIMLNMDWDLLDDVHAKISLTKNNRVYGSAASEAAVTVAADSFVVDQGYFKIDKVFGLLDMTFGRQFFGEKGDLIAYYGPKDSYGLPVTAIDGARFDWAGEKAYATVVVFEPGNAHPGLAPAQYTNTVDVRGFIVGNKGHENIDGKVYVWNQMTHGAYNDTASPMGTRNDNLFVLGTKVKAKFGGLYGSLEAAMNLGENRRMDGAVGISKRYAGKAFLADVGMKADVEQIGTFNPWAMFGYGSGNGDNITANGAGQPNHNMDFTPIATDFRPGALYGRFEAGNANAVFGNTVMGGASAAANGLTNRIIMAAGVKATPTALNKLTAGLAIYNIRYQNIGADLGPQAVLVGGHRSIGQEYDVTAEWKHSENVSLKGTVANFQPGDAIRYVGRANALNSAWMSALDVAVKF